MILSKTLEMFHKIENLKVRNVNMKQKELEKLIDEFLARNYDFNDVIDYKRLMVYADITEITPIKYR